MDNHKFTEDLKQKLQAAEARLRGDEQLSDKERASIQGQIELLRSAIKIMTYGTGPERRRFRRDYERRLGQ